MSDLICKNCGGTMQADENNEYAICEYCGAKQKIEKSEAELKAEILKKKQQERNEYKEKLKQKTKTSGKKIKKIIIILVSVIVAFYAIMLVLSFCGVFDDNDNTSNNASTNDTSMTSNINESTQAQKEVIELLDLFDSFETAKQILGEETEETQDIEEYTKHTFGDVSILCTYETNNIYCINIDCDSAITKNEYTISGININSSQEIWDSNSYDIMYNNYNIDGDLVCDYIIKSNERTFTTEIVFKANIPDKIIIFEESEENY